MTIYILDNDPEKIAEYLDDKLLDKMIRDIAQILCNSHREGNLHKVYDKFLDTIPLNYRYKDKNINEWAQWAIKCKLNYFYLANLGLTCTYELGHRFEFNTSFKCYIEKWVGILLWALENVPNLTEGAHSFFSNGKDYYGEDAYGAINLEKKTFIYCEDRYEAHTSFPIIMPKKYFKLYPYKIINIIESYRNYYQSKLIKKEVIWTIREKPKWLWN